MNIINIKVKLINKYIQIGTIIHIHIYIVFVYVCVCKTITNIINIYKSIE